ncbi:TlpA family protein disulfide reductase [Hymenobacter weizhouensis]|uniref:TlpA family protein disulfide reductase n=1 Tax=Hymenobacter sp. YIM 151500-1 TaxID=2987689 RepID=UPI00222716A1|nr:TlpA disulfide reductase family protein [Hymenobacter sp. YIM 151500-1]UYZ64697.1 TlpA family protein disulfide reductase [Hymenobacter sp. YIM 151500-1]
MKNTVIVAGVIALSSWGFAAQGQNRHTVFKDAAGNATTYIAHYDAVFRGTHKSIYDKKHNTRTLVPLPAAEFAQEKARTAQRILWTQNLGRPFPPFVATTYAGQRISSAELQGKVLVLNFWFVGCSTCEMEMPELNDVYATYHGHPDVVFLSLVRSKPAVVTSFLAATPFHYPVASLTPELLTQLKPPAFPTNVVVDKSGQYSFESVGGGVGGVGLLKRAIAQALR